jgi:hypothetical protein
MKYIFAFLLLALTGSACADAPSDGSGDSFIVHGRYHYEFGDRIAYDCKQAKPCEALLLRDLILQKHVDELDGKNITLEVVRVDACKDKHATGASCATSEDGTALYVLRWIEPNYGTPP